MFPANKLSNRLEKLLEETSEAYYWIGFLIADGHFEDRGRLHLTLSIKDAAHIEKFAEFIKYASISESRVGLKIGVMDTSKMSQITKKFNLNRDKTHFPPKIIFPNDNLFLSLLIGFIDGDGSIGKQSGRHDCILRVKCHANWRSTLQTWFDRLYQLSNIETLNVNVANKTNCRINNQGYANIQTGNSRVLVFLKRKTEELGLPVMSRKWEKIPDKISSRYKSKELKEAIKRALTKGEKVEIIAKRFKVNYQYVWRIKNPN